MVESTQELVEVVSGVLLLEATGVCDVVEEAASVDELKEDVLERSH